MKRLEITLFLLLVVIVGASAQQSIKPGDPDYDRLKEEGKLPVGTQAPRAKNYPMLRDAREKSNVTDNQRQAPTAALVAAAPCTVEDPSNDPTFDVLAQGDDGSSIAVTLPFSFNFYGSNHTTLYVNINGNVTFDTPNGTYSSTGFPFHLDMIAPFWADVDTRGIGSGQVYYKVESNRLTVIWHRVGYYLQKVDKTNTFKLVLTDGNDTSIGIGNNVAFFYDDMQWTTGDASQGPGDGFGGIPATVGMENGQGADSCFFFQLGRFGKRGTEFVDHASASGVDYLDYKCFYYDVSTIETLAVDFNYNKLVCAIDFIPQIHNPQNCAIGFFMWDFGDGDAGFDMNMIHSYSAPGTYKVTFYMEYSCGNCDGAPITIEKQINIDAAEDALIDTVIRVNTHIKDDVLAASVNTFLDAWPLPQTLPGLSERHGFANGTEGVWRSEGTHVYDVPRKRTEQPDLATDGTFSLDHFSWANAEIEAIPHWIKASSVTSYSPFSYELENRDVLGVYSAALYDYGGHLPSANGVNMRHLEMAFTGFEFLDGKSSGNWIFGNQPLPQSYIYPTLLSYKNVAVVKASVQDFANVTHVDVTGRSFFLFGFRRTKTITGNEIICVRPHPSNPDWSLLVLREALFSGIWIGEIKVNNEIVPIVSPDIDNTYAHTGKSSLKITAAKVFKQDLLRLDSGKRYVVSAWVSVNNPHVTTPKLANDLGIEVIARDKQDVLLSTTPLVPSGTIIEGWQQVKGVFTCPDQNTYIELKFKPGSTGTAWYDDLRLHPDKGNMRSYVYDMVDYRLRAILDEENFASLFFYDQEGNLYLTQKETTDGIKTLSENVSFQVENHN
ncbi:hypothetical protein KK062_11065 [Fulvivirgaceae bacterium PWU5]|uniref:PKD domain-containing protein n=1 Tax=Dawidia cretensis TaxID=2782350 RepID=A0AAP2DZP3_9BACT|nr:nidogen-like domain-containing protein [Dawidia cretensis]MBT1708769.1 hypothetical protein [Dawidia cretensis]